MPHSSVLLQASIDALAPKEGEIFLDATLDGGGHSEEVLARTGARATIVGIDLDRSTLALAGERLKKKFPDAKIFLEEGNFRNLDKILEKLKIGAPDKILFDLGTSAFSLEESGRGFSFKSDEPLLMTFKEAPSEEDVTAMDVVNKWGEKTLADIIYGFGGERYSRKIARAIVENREKKAVETSGELREIILKATPHSYHYGKIDPATRTFQAIRIAVNDELGALKEGIEKGFAALTSGGRMAVISFHSLEDRIVKEFFRKMKNEGAAEILTKKPLVASRGEIEANPRARSAKLRIISKK